MSEVIFNLRRRNRGRKEAEGLRAVGSVVGISAGVDGGCAAGFQIAGGDRIDAGLGRDRGLRRRPLHARHGAERGEVFLATNPAASACPAAMGSQKMVDILTGWTQGKGIGADMAADRRADRGAEADVHLRAGPDSRTAPSQLGAGAFSRRGRSARSSNRRCPEGVCPMREERHEFQACARNSSSPSTECRFRFRRAPRSSTPRA